MASFFEKLDSFVAGFISDIFNKIGAFLADFFGSGGKGAYIAFIFLAVFMSIVILVGLFNLIKKFKVFIFIAIITLVLPILWFIFT